MTLKVFDTFTGIGGFTIPLVEMGHEIVGYSEIDKYAIQIYQKHFPNHKNYGNIEKIDWNTVPDFDLLTGGTPCQDLSIAGKRAGLEGAKSGLFRNYVYALEQKKPKYFIWENVKGALSSNQGWDFAEVLCSFSEAGYAIQWQVLNSKNHGVAQNRERIFVVGTRGESSREVFPFRYAYPEIDELQGQQTNTLTARYEKAQATGSYIIEGKQHAQEIHQLNNPKHSNNRVYGTGGGKSDNQHNAGWK